jgi:hypothetical protein
MNFLIPPDDDATWNSSTAENEVVRVGKAYQEFDDYQRLTQEAYLSERKSHGTFQTPVRAPNEPQPNEMLHCPLSGEHDMRILEVYPGEFDDTLHCRLHLCSVGFEYPRVKAPYIFTEQDHGYVACPPYNLPYHW